MIRISWLLIFFCFSNFLFSQDMTSGFNLLETGKYEEAKVYFKTIVNQYPTNRTAQLCYGRAVGLSGNPQKAKDIFYYLMKNDTNSLEFKLNFGESLLWNKEYESAKGFYSQLIAKYPNDFGVNLGMANTLSNLKEYPQALNYINRALTIKPKDPNATLSKKYILLGGGYEFGQRQLYDSAYLYLNQIFIDFPNDKQAIMTISNVALAQKNYSKATSILDNYPMKTNVDSVQIWMQKSLIAHGDGKNKQSLDMATKAYMKASSIQDSVLNQEATNRFIQSLLWNNKFKDADFYMQKNGYSLQSTPPKLATLGEYQNLTFQFKNAEQTYCTILSKDSNSFDGNLGIANNYYTQRDFIKSFYYLDQAQKAYPQNPDIFNFRKKLDLTFTPEFYTKISKSIDKAEDEALTTTAGISLPFSTTFKILAEGTYRRTFNDLTKIDAKVNKGQLGFEILAGHKFELDLYGKYTELKFDSIAKSYFLYKGRVRAYFNPINYIEAGADEELQDYNTSLVKLRLKMRHVYSNLYLYSHKRYGVFAQYYFTAQSDTNTRHLFYTSFFYNFQTNPVLKAGIAYQFISFSKSKPLEYFSPTDFHALGAFIIYEVTNDLTKKTQFLPLINLTGGFQKIESNTPQTTYRVEGQLAYKFAYRWRLGVYGLYTNLSSTTAAGYNYLEYGFKLNILIGNKLFKPENQYERQNINCRR